MKSVNTYLNFSGNTEQAFNFYQSVFGGGFETLLRYSDMKMPDMPSLSESDASKIAHVALPLADGGMLMGTDSIEGMGPPLSPGNNFHIAIEPDSTEEAHELFEALSEGGSTTMAPQQTEWAEQFAMCTDKFGVQWMINYTGNAGN